MSAIKNKVEWCLRKAKKEGKMHRGLLKTSPKTELAAKHIKKAEHNLAAITEFRKIGYSDWSASAGFYSIYHCLLAILAKKGYESRNQECTFALIYNLIETESLQIDKELISSVRESNPEEHHKSPTIIELRELEQYGVTLSLENDAFNKLLSTAKAIMDQTKEALETLP